MGKITIDEMHKSLFDYAQTISDESLMTENKTIVGAINEIYGKNLIADSIGEPLNNTDTFTKMSNDINNLLSTFKTNMMNAGVTVASNDKFKTLIDKIATMVEEGEGKGIQYASGDGTISSLPYRSSGYQTYVINTNLDFTPTVIFWTVESLDYRGEYGSKTGWELYETANSLINVSRSTCLSCSLSDAAYDCNFYLSNINSESFTLNYEISLVTYSGACGNVVYHWYAIGVGEEDTALRDSLASILEDEGVNVTEEDTMADLIVKVDEEFDRKNTELENNKGLDIISATELPSEVVNNRIVLITANTPTDINVKDSSLCNPTTNGEMNIGIVTVPDDSGVPYNITQNNIMMSLYLKVAKERVNNIVSTLNGYTGIGGQWVQFSRATFLVYDNGQDNYGISTSSNWSLSYASFSIGVGDIAVHINGHGDNSWQNAAGWFNKKFDLTNYSTLKITGTKHSSVTFGFSKSKGTTASMSKSFSLGTSSSEITVDISSLTGEYYLLVKGRSLTTTYAAASISRFELIP